MISDQIVCMVYKKKKLKMVQRNGLPALVTARNKEKKIIKA